MSLISVPMMLKIRNQIIFLEPVFFFFFFPFAIKERDE